jgi:UDP-3-O-acyl-N-acetylglucosamine deacetylase
MMDSENSQMLSMIVNTVEKLGCKLADVDLDNHVINLEGPEKNKEACAKALAQILD